MIPENMECDYCDCLISFTNLNCICSTCSTRLLKSQGSNVIGSRVLPSYLCETCKENRFCKRYEKKWICESCLKNERNYIDKILSTGDSWK